MRENKLNRKKERFWSIGLNKKNVILYNELLAMGADNKVAIRIQDVLRMAIYKMATELIIIHNHPSGHLKPSNEDKNITEAIKHGGFFTDIKLRDHLIITENGYFSFKGKKLLKN